MYIASITEIDNLSLFIIDFKQIAAMETMQISPGLSTT